MAEMKCEICGSIKYVTFSRTTNQHVCGACRIYYKKYNTYTRKAKVKSINICSICGKTGTIKEVRYNSKYGDKLCRKHEGQFLKKGEILDNNPRTTNTLNEHIIYDDYVKIFLYNIKSEIIGETLVDIEDFEKIKDKKIGVTSELNGKRYAIIGYDRVLLHNIIMNPTKNQTVDHIINENTLDNRKSNLRFSNKTTNGQNAKNKKNNTSGVSGVSWNKKTKSYETYINVFGKRIRLGYFEDFEKAKYVRFKAEIEHFQDFTFNKQDKLDFIENYKKEITIHE